MMGLLITIALLGAAFGALFIIAELLHRFGGWPGEATRKLTHIGTGLLALLFPRYLNLWQTGLLCGLFLVILLWSKRAKQLNAINGITRKSDGAALYPVAVFLLFCLYTYLSSSRNAGANQWLVPIFLYAAPLLVLAFADPAAALTGKTYRKLRRHDDGGKSLAGSFGFFMTALAVMFILCGVYQIPTTTPISCAIILAAGCGSAAEYVSGRGWDNLSVPGSVALVLLLSEYF